MAAKTGDDKNTLKKETISSGAWGFMDKGLSVVVQFIIGIVLARLLPVSDFGLIGLGLIVIGFGQIFVNLGLGPALVQKQDLNERHVRVVFTTSVIAGIILALTSYSVAPFMTVILDNENVVPIVEALSFIFIIAGFTIPSRSLLRKALDFKHIFYVSLASRILYGTSTIILATLGYGVWSLVIGNILQRFVTFLFSYWYVRHSMKPLLAKKEFLDLFHFGSGMTLSGIFNYFALQGDYFIIGKVLGAEALGLYTKAYTLMLVPTTKFVSVLSSVLFPAASRIQKFEERLRKIFLKAMYIIAFTATPICTILVLLAPELIVGLYGPKWVGTILPLQILGLFGVFRAMYNASAAFLRAKGWVYGIFLAQVVYGITMVTGVWFGAKWYGLIGASWAVGFAIFVMWCMFMEINSRALKVKRIQILKTLVPGIVISLIVAIPCFLVNQLMAQYITTNVIRLVISCFLALLFYGLAFLYTPQFLFYHLPSEVLNLVEDYLPKKWYFWILKFTKLERK